MTYLFLDHTAVIPNIVNFRCIEHVSTPLQSNKATEQPRTTQKSIFWVYENWTAALCAVGALFQQRFKSELKFRSPSLQRSVVCITISKFDHEESSFMVKMVFSTCVLRVYYVNIFPKFK